MDQVRQRRTSEVTVLRIARRAPDLRTSTDCQSKRRARRGTAGYGRTHRGMSRAQRWCDAAEKKIAVAATTAVRPM